MSYTVHDYYSENNPTKQRVLGFLSKSTSEGISSFLLIYHVKQQKWNGFGGKVGDFQAESLLEALRREAGEELHITPTTWETRGTVQTIFTEGNVVKSKETTIVFTVSEWKGRISASSEALSPTWYKLSEFPWDAMWPNDKEWLPLMLQSDSLLSVTYTIIDSRLQPPIITRVS